MSWMLSKWEQRITLKYTNHRLSYPNSWLIILENNYFCTLPPIQSNNNTIIIMCTFVSPTLRVCASCINLSRLHWALSKSSVFWCDSFSLWFILLIYFCFLYVVLRKHYRNTGYVLVTKYHNIIYNSSLIIMDDRHANNHFHLPHAVLLISYYPLATRWSLREKNDSTLGDGVGKIR